MAATATEGHSRSLELGPITKSIVEIHEIANNFSITAFFWVKHKFFIEAVHYV